MAQKVKFKRKTTSEIDNLEIEDGSLIYNVENGKTYMDYGNDRIPTGGGANGGIYVGDTEPTDPDITLWVDTPMTETKASEIVNEYTESDTVGYSTNYVNGINDYSTDEVFTGKHWIDGKPIYRKVISGTLPTSNYSTFITITDLDTPILENILITNTDGSKARLPFVQLVNNKYCDYYISGNTYNVHFNIDTYSNRPFVAILEYTKTTD